MDSASRLYTRNICGLSGGNSGLEVAAVVCSALEEAFASCGMAESVKDDIEDVCFLRLR